MFVREESETKAECPGDIHSGKDVFPESSWVLDERHVPGHHTLEGEVQEKTERIKYQSFPIMPLRKELQSPKHPRVVTKKQAPTDSLVTRAKVEMLSVLWSVLTGIPHQVLRSSDTTTLRSHSLKSSFNDSQGWEILAFSYLLGALITSHKTEDTIASQ